MTRIFLALTLACCSNLPAWSNEPIASPKDVPPLVGTAIAIPDKGSDYYSVKLSVPQVRWSVVGKKRPKLEWPKLKVTATNTKLMLLLSYDRSESRPLSQLSENAQNRIVDLQGKRLSSDEVLKRLKAETAVLISVSGNMPDAYYLQTTKPGTLIAILGFPVMPAPKLLSQPENN